MIVIELNEPPQGKGRPRFRVVKTRGGAVFGNAYTPINTRKFEGRLQAAAVSVMNGRQPLDGALVVVIRAFMPVPQSWPRRKRDAALTGVLQPTTKPDWENIAKTLDAFNGVVWIDDRQIVDGRVIKSYSEKPGLMVEVKPVETALTAVTGTRAAVGA